jgi:hypothetical protein
LNQTRRFFLAVLLTFTVILPVTAQNRSTWERRPAQIHSSDERGALTFPSADAPAAVVGRFLASHGHDAATVRTVADVPARNGIASQSAGFSPSDDGLMHIRADQRVTGLVVYGSYIKAAINQQPSDESIPVCLLRARRTAPMRARSVSTAAGSSIPSRR